ncbi:hypothetical protein [Wielerella bovis]|uniref:hypothetical protein n=1 Tax=Wielerella bovis TaxID=2917790 RepID=UPI002018E65B|nr:hypothetical protein [Wielerella bovis]ULJ64496.1 hypothetical protein MIS33_10225 [Wielerella bovis]ULJ66782.1 hypothetical protein MIS31_11185 [Wielerella bovis]
MIDLNEEYLNEVKNNEEKQIIIEQLKPIAEHSPLADILQDNVAFDQIYLEAKQQGLDRHIKDYLIMYCLAPPKVLADIKEYLRNERYSAWGNEVSKDQLFKEFLDLYIWNNYQINPHDFFKQIQGK